MLTKRVISGAAAVVLAAGAAGVPAAGEVLDLGTALTASAATAESGECGDNASWVLDENGTLTISGTGEIDGFEVFPSSSVKKIVINNGITGIGYESFAYCKNLKSITIPDSVTSIGESAFYSCESLTSLTIPKGVTKIADRAFYSCKSLKSVTIPNGVTKIADEVFYDCESLTSVTIPNSVTSIGESAFERCESLASITIPDSVTSIGASAFSECNQLKSVNIPKKVTSISNGVFSGCDGLTKVTIPSGITNIGNYAYANCNNLTSVNIPDSVTSIGSDAFMECQKLKSVTIPKSVKSIGEYAFGYFYYYSYMNSGLYDMGGEAEARLLSDFKIKCYSGTAGEKYAKDNGITYELLDGGTSSKTSITKASFKLSSTSITYTGKAKMPKLTVTYKGKTLVKGKDYKVTLSNSKKVGKATATITGIGSYTGTKKLTYYVVPVKPTISKVTSTAKKKATVQWKKNTTATGYQIQVSMKKNFSSKKSYSVSKNTTVKTTISKLTSGKTYYVRMRAYKTIDGAKRYSAYSAVKSVKVK